MMMLFMTTMYIFGDAQLRIYTAHLLSYSLQIPMYQTMPTTAWHMPVQGWKTLFGKNSHGSFEERGVVGNPYPAAQV